MIYTRTLKEENNQEPVYEHKTSRFLTPADSNHQTTLVSGVEKNPLGGLGFAEALQRKEWLAWLTTVECEAMASMPANTGCSENTWKHFIPGLPTITHPEPSCPLEMGHTAIV